jgi:hypothetical protein
MVLCALQKKLYPIGKALSILKQLKQKTLKMTERDLQDQKQYFQCANYIPSYLGNIGRCGTVVAGHTAPQ